MRLRLDYHFGAEMLHLNVALMALFILICLIGCTSASWDVALVCGDLWAVDRRAIC